MADENETIKIKCPRCDKEYGISPNAFNLADNVKIECYCGTDFVVKFEKATKTLVIKTA